MHVHEISVAVDVEYSCKVKCSYGLSYFQMLKVVINVIHKKKETDMKTNYWLVLTRNMCLSFQ